MSKSLWVFFKEGPASVSGDIVLAKTVINIESAKDIYKAKIEKYGEKVLNFDDKYSQVCATIRLSCEDGFCVQVKDVESPHEI